MDQPANCPVVAALYALSDQDSRIVSNSMPSHSASAGGIVVADDVGEFDCSTSVALYHHLESSKSQAASQALGVCDSASSAAALDHSVLLHPFVFALKAFPFSECPIAMLIMMFPTFKMLSSLQTTTTTTQGPRIYKPHPRPLALTAPPQHHLNSQPRPITHLGTSLLLRPLPF